jgi:integrase
VCACWRVRHEKGEMTASTCARYEWVVSSFVRFARASGYGAFPEVNPRVVNAFVYASLVGGITPAPSTSRFRLTVVRDAYAGLAAAGRANIDPTAGLCVASSAQLRRPEPLTPAETVRLRFAGRISPRDHLRPAAVELALAGGSHAEIARTVVADLDLQASRVRLGTRTSTLDSFAATALGARVSACRRAADRARRTWDPSATSVALARPLAAYPATSIAPSISSSLSRAMTSAGLRRPGVRPASLREFAANRHYALHGIEAVAEFLGLESLDAARGLIHMGWQQEFAEEVRSIDGD